MKNINERAEILLMEYAAGALDEASALLAAAYVFTSPQAMRFFRQCEAIGGALLERCCEPVAMAEGSLGAVLSRLEDGRNAAPSTLSPDSGGGGGPQAGPPLPPPLARYMASCGRRVRWHPVYPGMRVSPLGVSGCVRHAATLVRMAPGAQAPRHRHEGVELTLVLDGGYSDESGCYRAGDLAVAEAATVHSPRADREAGCACLVVNAGSVRFTGGPLAAFLNILLR